MKFEVVAVLLATCGTLCLVHSYPIESEKDMQNMCMCRLIKCTNDSNEKYVRDRFNIKLHPGISVSSVTNLYVHYQHWRGV